MSKKSSQVLILKFGAKVWLFLASLVFSLTLTNYFTGEDFVFIDFAHTSKPFYDLSQKLFYRPIPNLLWELDYHWWGLHATGYHLTNLVLHGANCLLVGLLVENLGIDQTVALLTAGIFAVQPIHVEPLAWLSGRPDLLATFFFLLAILATIHYFKHAKGLYYWFGLLIFGVGLFCKESVAGFPLIWLGLAFFSNVKISRTKLALQFVPYLLLGAGYLAVRLGTLGGLGGYSTQGSDWLYILWNATVGLWLPSLFPFNFETIGWLVGLVLVILLIIIYSLLIKSFWRNIDRNNLIIALLLIYGGVLPVLGIGPVTPNLAQSRLLYLPSIGFCLLVALSLQSNHKLWMSQLLMLIYLISLTTGFWTWWQAGQMVSETFAQLTAAHLPIAAGDTVYYEGLPDSWHGAYLWRNGAEEATTLLVGPDVKGLRRTRNLIIDYNRTRKGRLWFVRYSLNPNGNLDYRFSYSVDDGLAQKNVETKSCTTLQWEWQTSQGQLQCDNDRGWFFNTGGQKSNLVLQSPLFNMSGHALSLELTAYIDYDFQQPQALGEVFLNDSTGNTLFQQPFDLAADGRSHRYRLNFPVAQPGLLQVGIRLSKFRTNILWQTISLEPK